MTSSTISLSYKTDKLERNSSFSDVNAEYKLTAKLLSGIKWLVEPLKTCSVLKANYETEITNHPYDFQNLDSDLNQVSNLLKYFSFGVMFTNGIFGFILFLIGIWSSFEHRKINAFSKLNINDSTSFHNPFRSIGITLCVFGLLIFILCIISCLGINRENLNLLRVSIFGQSITLLSFIIFAIVLLFWGERIRNKIADAMIIGLNAYYHMDIAWGAFFDQLQTTYFCCGIYSFNDWNSNPQYACTTSNILQSFDACSVPYTCCRRESQKSKNLNITKSINYKCGEHVLPLNNITVNMNDIAKRINVNGCYDEIVPILQQLIFTAAIFLFLICIIIFVTIFLTCLLSFEIRLTISNLKRYTHKRSDRSAESQTTIDQRTSEST